MVRSWIAFGTLMLSGMGHANTTFECGAVACSAFGSQPITGINDVVVDGDHFDVAFTNTPDSTFLFSSHASSSGQPLTGVDAANALDAFYATQQGPIPQADGPTILAQIDGVDTFVTNIVTAYQASGTAGLIDIDITEPFLGISLPPTVMAADAGDGVTGATSVVVSHVGSGFLCSASATCVKWTPIAAPVNAPEISGASAVSALTLLLGCLAVLRGRRSQRSARLTD